MGKTQEEVIEELRNHSDGDLLSSSAPHQCSHGEDRGALFASSATVRARGIEDIDGLRAIARERAPDPSVFDEHDAFFWSAEISSNRLDAYFTRMHNSTLRNFAEDASAGVSFLNSHRSGGFLSQGELGFGQSLRGRFIDGRGSTESVPRTVADFFTLPGFSFNDVSTDSLIAGIRSGLLRDVSVGFYGGMWRCDLCGNDLMNWRECQHYPGFEYEVETGSGENSRTVELLVATATIENARLAEVSSVYDGATPGAGVLKAQRASAAGQLGTDLARKLEAHYRIKLPDSNPLWPAGRMPEILQNAITGNVACSRDESGRWIFTPSDTETYTVDTRTIPAEDDTNDSPPTSPERIDDVDEHEEENSMGEQTPTAEGANSTPVEDVTKWSDGEYRAHLAAILGGGTAKVEEAVEVVRRLAAERDELSGLRVDAERLKIVEGERDAAKTEVEKHLAELERLRPIAQDGETYRRDLTTEAIEAGVRAHGEGFAKEKYERLLSTADLDTIRQMRDDWNGLGDTRFAGGRKTVENAEESNNSLIRSMPDSAFNG